MARLKKTSAVLEAAKQRLAGFRSVTPAPDFGTGLSVANYQTEMETFDLRLNDYNEKLSNLDQLLNELEAAEADLRESNRRMLSAAEAHYGPDSSEYEQVGGTRTRDRKRPSSKEENPTHPPS